MIEEQMISLRQEIAEIDASLLRNIAARRDCVEKLAYLKFKNDLPVRHCEIEKSIFERNVKRGDLLGLNRELVEILTNLLIEDAVSIQEKLHTNLTGKDPMRQTEKSMTSSEVEGSTS